jgi:hypothetical protein
MKPMTCVLVAFVLLGAVFAKDRPVEKGTIVEIILQNAVQSGTRTNSKTAYLYQMTVQVGCTLYTGAYSSPQQDLVQAYVPGDEMEVSVTRKRLYARFPGVEEFMEIDISSQRSADNCPAGK